MRISLALPSLIVWLSAVLCLIASLSSTQLAATGATCETTLRMIIQLWVIILLRSRSERKIAFPSIERTGTRVGCRSRGRLPKNTRVCKKLYNFTSLFLNYFRLIEGTLKRSKTIVSFF